MKSAVLVLLCLTLAGCAATAPTSSEQPSRVAGEVFESAEYFVVVAKSGDTVASLAGKYLGDASKGWMIEDYNGAAAIAPGQTVIIPKRQWNLSGVTANGYQLVPVLAY